MQGYWGNEEATREAIDEEGWLHTGDIGRVDGDGFLYITDRKKDILITSGGKNIAPQPIEQLLTAQPAIAQVVVVGDNYPYVTALLVPRFEDLPPPFAGRSHEELLADASFEKWIDDAVDAVNAQISEHERVRLRQSLSGSSTILTAARILPCSSMPTASAVTFWHRRAWLPGKQLRVVKMLRSSRAIPCRCARFR
jgi:long-chain acyl-CoA synthetase